ncbi:hypothetical protein PR048_012959 [Dryococelus australis]|uniref:Uncharacterized protein n=1 Tax=Dryococelus australis TaxID=614101 RepID=A0ABQ9HR90_9NEOP|nr:hypothetical protein PR048_012959 [Dryococelus australis]
MMIIEAKARLTTPKGNDEDDCCFHSIAFAELVAFLEDMNSDENNAPVLKLMDIAHMYKVRPEQLGLVAEKCIHTTALDQLSR